MWSALFLTVIPGLFGARDLLWPWSGSVFVLLAAVGFANVYGMDSSSLWLTVLTGSARVDVRGRQIGWLMAVGVPAMLGSVVLTIGSGGGAVWPWVFAVLLALLGAAAGIGPLVALLMPAPLPEHRGADPLDFGDDPTTGGGLMLQGLVVMVVVPLLAVPAGLAVWLLPPAAQWLGVLFGLAIGTLYTWGLGRLAATQLARNGPELVGRMRMRATSDTGRRRPQPSASTAKGASTLVSAATGILATVGMILLVPQGLIPLIFSAVAPGVRSWFIALYLPHDVQVPVSVLLALVGGLCLAAAWRVRRDPGGCPHDG